MQNINSDIKHPKYWNEMERQQKIELESLGLVANFKQYQSFKPAIVVNKKGEEIKVQVPFPRPLEGPNMLGRPPRFYVGTTIAILYKKSDYERAKKNNNYENIKQIVGAKATCSHLDQFNRQVGRVISTERALAAFRKLQE